jgi:lysophospholipase L1-like esterase
MGADAACCRLAAFYVDAGTAADRRTACRLGIPRNRPIELDEMFRRALSTFVLASAVACSAAPTGPSPLNGGAVVADVAQETPPAPPLDPLPGPRAIGVTRFVAFGDSITYGTLSGFDPSFLFDDPAGSYVNRAGTTLRQRFSAQSAAITFVNEGVPGEQARQGRQRIQSVILANRPGAILLLEGVNDMTFGFGAQDTALAVTDIIRVALQFNVPVLLGLMPQTYSAVYPNGEIRSQAADKIVAFNQALRSFVAGVPNVHVVDLYAAFGNNRSLIGNDGLHPTSAGYDVMANAFVQAIERAFPVRGSAQ